MPSGACQLSSSLKACGRSLLLLPSLFDARLALGSFGSAMLLRLPERMTPSSTEYTYDPTNCQLWLIRLVNVIASALNVFVPGTVIRRNASRPRYSGTTLYIVIERSSGVFRMLSGPASG